MHVLEPAPLSRACLCMPPAHTRERREGGGEGREGGRERIAKAKSLDHLFQHCSAGDTDMCVCLCAC